MFGRVKRLFWRRTNGTHYQLDRAPVRNVTVEARVIPNTAGCWTCLVRLTVRDPSGRLAELEQFLWGNHPSPGEAMADAEGWMTRWGLLGKGCEIRCAVSDKAVVQEVADDDQG